MRIIVPKYCPDLREFEDLPFFFLGGPIRGGGDWQHEMVVHLRQATDGNCVIACPARWNNTHPLAGYFLQEGADIFDRQLDWERHYLARAAWHTPRGCILFWAEEQREPRAPEAGPYGRDSYGELGEWRAHMFYRKETRVVIGGEEGFSGLDMVERNTTLLLGYDFPIYKTMEETARAAVEKAG